MNKSKTGKIIRTVYGYAFLALSVVLGALFLWQIIDILTLGIRSGIANAAGQGAYTRDIVGTHLHKIAPAIWLWIAFAVLAVVLWNVFPPETKKTPYGDSCYFFRRYERRIPAEIPEGMTGTYVAVKIRRIVLLALKIFCAVAVAAVAVYCIVYLALPASFSEAANANKEVIRMAKYLFPAVGAAMVLCIAVSVYAGISAKKLLPGLKKLTAGNKTECEISGIDRVIQKIRNVFDNKWVLLGIRCAVLAAGVVMLIVGISNGNMAGVFQKAIYICTECIGLG